MLERLSTTAAPAHDHVSIVSLAMKYGLPADGYDHRED